jgi:phosphoribosylamine--glycine ligase
MNILLLGSGGREHALAWKLTQSPLCTQLYIAPGNAGTRELGENIAIEATDFQGIKRFIQAQPIDMVVVGPEEPLVKGVYDFFQSDEALKHIPVIGPSAAGAQLEGSKAFAKGFMQRQGIPTAAYREFELDQFEEGRAYIRSQSLPIVLKADGLAAGKGVVIAASHEEAVQTFEEMVRDQKFGEAGKKVVIEAFLDGIELSVFVLTDGHSYKILPEAKDYKRVGVGDTGPNTGGMGAVSPVPFADQGFMDKVVSRIVEPTIDGLQKEKPETEVVLPRLKNDLVELFVKVSEGRLHEVNLEVDSRAAVTTVAVSEGYPGTYPKGRDITGLGAVEQGEDVLVFQAGTLGTEGKVQTNGGRVLAVTAYGETIPSAASASRAALGKIFFSGIYFRPDIGYEFQ